MTRSFRIRMTMFPNLLLGRGAITRDPIKGSSCFTEALVADVVWMLRPDSSQITEVKNGFLSFLQ